VKSAVPSETGSGRQVPSGEEAANLKETVAVALLKSSLLGQAKMEQKICDCTNRVVPRSGWQGYRGLRR
jgi:hypothetical protein